MNILFYNWAPLFDKYHRGGGVSFYLDNLLPALINPIDNFYFLNSGVKYTFDKKTRIEEVKQNRCGVRQFEIINSPIIAPASTQFCKISEYFQESSLTNLLSDFVEKYSIDIIHFHNFEGISPTVLKIKNNHPNLKFIYTLHNYFSFCPQVNLWSNNGNCYLNNQFPHCSQCVIGREKRKEIAISQVKSLMGFSYAPSDSALYKLLKKQAMKYRHESDSVTNSVDNIDDFLTYREENIELINRFCDCIIAVSERTKSIAVNYGIRPERIIVEYIGSNAVLDYSTISLKRREEVIKEPFTLTYLGYAREDKGFYFLLQALENLDDVISRQIKLNLYAKITPDSKDFSSELARLNRKFLEVTFHDGFSKEMEPGILLNTSLGIIPNLWEDNLPQVAIEFAAAGVPILVSDSGGASELISNPLYVFKSGNEEDFLSKLTGIFSGRFEDQYVFSANSIIKDMKTHASRILQLYRNSL